jgi:hypothetical protein
MKVGDLVEVIKSPYSHIKKYTRATIVEIRENHLGRGKHLYVLDLSHKNFWKHEIRPVILL